MLLFYLSLIDTEKDKSKFEQLYNQYSRLMKYIALDILKDDFLAEDAVHNAFLKLIKYLDGIEDISSHKTKAFIVIVIKSVTKDMYAKQKRQSTISIDDNENLLITEDISLEKFDLEHIVSKIEELSDIYKDVLILKYVNEFKDAEISNILNISCSTVRKRIERAKIKLAQLLQSER